ncbi:MAG: enoyl-CoA hydratase-related protein [Deltaproteobacteria bacterium]|nr:enoyl-CoA hydratase-related protein [Deltaproteobacteria bacterium]MCL5879181.1 enoyl-CoA hydratase-related protein [Deltaproteobacteria bacterium]
MGIVEYKKKAALGIITMNRPDAMNAINAELGNALLKSLIDAEYDKEVRAILLTGTGRAFSSGGDVKAMLASAEPKGKFFKELTVYLNGIINTILMMRKPVIAGMNGAAAGAGVSLALACDLVTAARSSRFNLAYTKIGLTPDGGATAMLAHHVGPKRAMEYIMLNPDITAEQALEIGLVNRVFDDSTFAEQTISFAQALAGGPTVAFAYTKRTMNHAYPGPLERILELEREGIAACGSTEDFKEASAAFVEKRTPVFKGS